MLKTATFVVLLAVVGGSLAQNYCALCADHTMCIFSEVGPKCGTLLASGTSTEDIAAIVNAHNNLRAQVATGQETQGSNGAQPPAANMRKMVWDPELATVAQRWTNQCDFGHDACREVERFSVGQNAFMSSSSSIDDHFEWSTAVESWYSEVKDFDKNNISPFQFDFSTGHYTQVAWADSYAVGCGFAKFPNGAWFSSYFVCNYGPSGNYIGNTMYEVGDACSRCPEGTTTCDNGLCA